MQRSQIELGFLAPGAHFDERGGGGKLHRLGDAALGERAHTHAAHAADALGLVSVLGIARIDGLGRALLRAGAAAGALGA